VTPLSSISSLSRPEVVLCPASAADSQPRKTPLSQLTQNAAGSLASSNSGQKAQSSVVHDSVSGGHTPITKQGRLQSASPGRGPGTPVTQNAGVTSGTPTTKASTSASPARVVSASAAKHLQSGSPGRVSRTPVTQKNTGGGSGTPTTRASTSASPARAVSASAAKRFQSASPARTPATAMKAVTSASPARVLSGSATKRPPPASPGRVPGTLVTQKSTGGTLATKPSTSASPGVSSSAAKRPQMPSPGRILGTPVTEKTPAPAKKTVTLASPGRLLNGSAAKRPTSASPGRMPRTPVAPKNTGGTPTTKPSTSASPGLAVSSSQTPTITRAKTPTAKPTPASLGRVPVGTKRLQSASPGRVMSTAVIASSRVDIASRIPTPKPTALSASRTQSASVAKRPHSASPARVIVTKTGAASTPKIKQSALASHSHAPSSLDAKEDLESPMRVLSTQTSTRGTPTTANPSATGSTGLVVNDSAARHRQQVNPGRVVSRSAAKRQKSTSPERVLRTPGTEKSAVGSSQTPTTKPSPSRADGGSAAKLQKSASPGLIPGTPKTRKKSTVSVVSETPTTKAATSARRSRVVNRSAAKRGKSTSPGRAPSTPGTEETTATVSQTPTAKLTSPSPGRVVSGSAVKRRKSSISARVPGTPKTPTTKAATSARRSRVMNRSAAKRGKSTSPARAPSTPGTEESSATAALTPGSKPITPTNKPSTTPSPGRSLSGSAAKLQKSASPGIIPGTPKSRKKSTVSASSETPMSKARTPASSGRVVNRSAAKRQKSVSSGHVPSTSGTVETTGAASPTPTSKPETPTAVSTSPSPGRVVSGSTAKRQKSASMEHVPGTPQTQKSASQTPTTKPSPGHVVTGSPAKRGKSISPGRVSSTPKTLTTKASAAKRQKSFSPGRVASTAGMDENIVSASQTPVSKPTVSPSRGCVVRVSSAKRQQSASPKRVPITPGTVGSSQTPTTKPKTPTAKSAPGSRGRVVSGSATKRGKSTSPKRVPSTPRSEDSSNASAYQTPSSEPTMSPSRGRVASGSAAKRRKSASLGRTTASPKSSASPSRVSRPSTPKPSPRPSGSGAKRLESPSPQRAAATAMSDSDDSRTSASPAQRRRSSVTKRRKSDISGRSTESEAGAVGTSGIPSQQASDSDDKHRHSASPVHNANTPVSQKSSLSPKTGTPKSARQGATMTLSSSQKQSAKRGVKRSGGPLEEPPSKQVVVSFGPQMSPELFDQRLPPITPVRRGATPKRIGGTANLLKPALKGRHSIAGTVVEEETEYVAVSVGSAKAIKSAKHRSKSAEHSPATLEPNSRAMAASSPKPVMKARRSSLGTSIAEETMDVEVLADRTPKTTKRRSQSARHASETVDGKEKAAKSSKKRSKSLTTVDDQELHVENVTKKDASVKRSRSQIGSKDAMAGGDNLDNIAAKKAPMKAAAAGHGHSTATSAAIVKRTPTRPFHYRSPTLETGSIKVKGSKKMAVPSNRVRSLSPVKVVVRNLTAAASPVRVSRTPQKPLRYRSPTLVTGSIKAQSSKKVAVPSPKRARSISRTSLVSSTEVGESSDSGIGKKGNPAAKDVEPSPTSIKPSITVQVMHSPLAAAVELSPVKLLGSKPKSAAAVRSKAMVTPESAKKRKSLTASGQKGKKSPVVRVMPLSSGKKAISPRPGSGRISSSPASGKKQNSGGKTMIVDSAEKSMGTAMSGRVMTPGRMVAMRAVFGQEMTPKLKVPNEGMPSKVSQAIVATSAKKGATEAAKPSSSQMSSAKRSTAKAAALKKSTRKSTAKKTLWSEVVRRAAAPPKSGPKIIKPVVVKAQKMQTALAAVVSIVFCCYLCWGLNSAWPSLRV